MAGAPPRECGKWITFPAWQYLIFKRVEEIDYTFPEDFHVHAKELVTALLRRDTAGMNGRDGWRVAPTISADLGVFDQARSVGAAWRQRRARGSPLAHVFHRVYAEIRPRCGQDTAEFEQPTGPRRHPCDRL